MNPSRRLIIGGLYRHRVTRGVYRATGIARSAEDPAKLRVVYEQVRDGTIRYSGEALPAGTLWTRDLGEFLAVDDHGQERFEYVYRNIGRK